MSNTERDAPDATLEWRLKATRFVLAERERELLALKGPCSCADCNLHYAHYGPCDTQPKAVSE